MHACISPFFAFFSLSVQSLFLLNVFCTIARANWRVASRALRVTLPARPTRDMAFLPKVKNSYLPVANKSAWRKEMGATRKIHMQKLSSMKPVTAPRWGGLYNGVREFKQPQYYHVSHNPKRAQMQEERHHAINLENMMLLDKVVAIAGRNSMGDPSREYYGGLRLTNTQTPIIDHFRTTSSTTFGAAIEPVSLNIGRRRREAVLVEAENRALLSRLYSAEPTYSRAGDRERARFREEWIRSHESEDCLKYREQFRTDSVSSTPGASRGSVKGPPGGMSHASSRAALTSRPSRAVTAVTTDIPRRTVLPPVGEVPAEQQVSFSPQVSSPREASASMPDEPSSPKPTGTVSHAVSVSAPSPESMVIMDDASLHGSALAPGAASGDAATGSPDVSTKPEVEPEVKPEGQPEGEAGDAAQDDATKNTTAEEAAAVESNTADGP